MAGTKNNRSSHQLKNLNLQLALQNSVNLIMYTANNLVIK